MELTDSEKSFVVSSWRSTAVLVATGKEGGITHEQIAEDLKLSTDELVPIVERLTEIGIVVLEEGKYKTGFKRLFLPKKNQTF